MHVSYPVRARKILAAPTYLLVEVEMCEGEFDGFPNLLLLHVQPADVSICHVRLLVCPKHGYRGVGLGGEDVNEGIRVSVQGYRGRRLE